MLHEKGQTYKDLTLENILLDDEGHVVLTDFGLSRGVRFQPGISGVIGTPEYLPPEVILSQG